MILPKFAPPTPTQSKATAKWLGANYSETTSRAAEAIFCARLNRGGIADHLAKGGVTAAETAP